MIRDAADEARTSTVIDGGDGGRVAAATF